jgi:hypothetical protein
MSWSIKRVGTREEVRKAVEADTNLPSTVKAVILDHLGWGDKAPNGVRVETYGHHDGGGVGACSISKLEIEPLELLLPAPAAVAEQPPEQAQAGGQTSEAAA